MHAVGVAAHHAAAVRPADAAAVRDVVSDDPVRALGREFAPCVGDDIGCLGREADDEARASLRVGGDRAQDVRVFDQGELWSRGAGRFLDLVGARARHAPIGDGGGEDADIGGQSRSDGRQHLLGGFDVDRRAA